MPMADTVARIKIKGSLFIEALENGVGSYPKYEGRWPVTAGLKFKFDPSKEPGSRILMDSITNVDGTPFDLEKEYVCAIKAYMKLGKDGYTCLLDDSIVTLPPIRGEDDPDIQDIFIQFFRRFMLSNDKIGGLTTEA